MKTHVLLLALGLGVLPGAAVSAQGGDVRSVAPNNTPDLVMEKVEGPPANRSNESGEAGVAGDDVEPNPTPAESLLLRAYRDASRLSPADPAAPAEPMPGEVDLGADAELLMAQWASAPSIENKGVLVLALHAQSKDPAFPAVWASVNGGPWVLLSPQSAELAEGPRRDGTQDFVMLLHARDFVDVERVEVRLLAVTETGERYEAEPFVTHRRTRASVAAEETDYEVVELDEPAPLVIDAVEGADTHDDLEPVFIEDYAVDLLEQGSDEPAPNAIVIDVHEPVTRSAAPPTGGGSGGVSVLGSTGGGGGGSGVSSFGGSGGSSGSGGGGSGSAGGGGASGGAWNDSGSTDAAASSPPVSYGNGGNIGSGSNSGSTQPDTITPPDASTSATVLNATYSGVYGRVVGSVIVLSGVDAVAWEGDGSVEVIYGEPTVGDLAVPPSGTAAHMDLVGHIGGSVFTAIPEVARANPNGYIVLRASLGEVNLRIWSKTPSGLSPFRDVIEWDASVTQTYDPAILMD